MNSTLKSQNLQNEANIHKLDASKIEKVQKINDAISQETKLTKESSLNSSKQVKKPLKQKKLLKKRVVSTKKTAMKSSDSDRTNITDKKSPQNNALAAQDNTTGENLKIKSPENKENQNQIIGE